MLSPPVVVLDLNQSKNESAVRGGISIEQSSLQLAYPAELLIGHGQGISTILACNAEENCQGGPGLDEEAARKALSPDKIEVTPLDTDGNTNDYFTGEQRTPLMTEQCAAEQQLTFNDFVQEGANALKKAFDNDLSHEFNFDEILERHND